MGNKEAPYNINGIGQPDSSCQAGKEQENRRAAETPVSRSSESVKGEAVVVINHSFVPDPEKHPFPPEVKKLYFLDSYYSEMTPTHTCMKVGISLRTFQEWCNTDRRFNQAFQEVFTAVGDRLKRVAMARGIRGSDDLIKFLLKYHDPGFRERSHLDIDPKFIDNIVNAMLDALRRTIPETCPHCKTNLGLTNKVNKMLLSLSKGVN